MKVTRKIIIVEPLIEKAISTICDAALKHEGLPIVSSVNAIKSAITEEQCDEKTDEEF